MKKRFVGGMALAMSLFVLGSSDVCASDIIFPKAGFAEFEYEIECEPIRHLPSYILMDEDADTLKRLGVLEAGGGRRC